MSTENAIPTERQVRDLTALAAWLIAMDDPDNAEGMEERRTVTLTKIIDRAKAALPGPNETPAGLCAASGGVGIGAGHECRCEDRAGHPPITADRPHGCSCGALW